MEKLFISIFQMSISASYLILAVLIVRFLLRKAPKSMRSFLWLLVGIRLLVPFSVESVFSLIPSTQTVNQYIYDMGQLEKNTITPKETTDTDKTLSQPEPSLSIASVPSAGKNDKMQTAVLFCSKIWLLGVVIMLGYMLTSWLRLKHCVRMAIPTDITMDCKLLKFYRSDAVESPFLFGIINPRIYIPNYIADEELPYVILHELTHRERRDHFIKPAGFMLLSIYWFNPCVWIAYIMLCKDIELICDEKVIRQLGTSHKKEYSQALLNSAVNRPANRRMIMACPIAFGGNGVRERVKNVLNYKKPAFWAFVAAVLACIIVPVCFMTQKKSDAVENENVSHETNFDTEDSADTVEINLDDIFTLEGTYEMLVSDAGKYLSIPQFSLEQNNLFSFGYDSFSSYMPYGTYELKDDVLTAVTNDGKYRYQFTRAGDSNDYNNIFFRFDAEYSSEVTCTDPNADAPVTDGALFVRNTASVLLAAAQEQSEMLNQELTDDLALTDVELLERQRELELLKIQLTYEQLALQRKLEKAGELPLSQEEKDVLEARYQELIQELDTAIQQLTADEAACQSAVNADENSVAARSAVEQWARAFCDRDGEAIVRLADEKLEQKLVEDDLLLQGFDGREDYVSFGWSSPWPWGSDYDGDTTKHNYRILSITDRSAEILYYAWVSNPHVTVWRETLTFTVKNGECLINSEELQFMDSICTAEEFQKAYPDGITGTMMDYYSYNDAGTDLNNHAVRNPSDSWYGRMLEPGTAAVCLLNILDNPNKVGVQVRESAADENTCIVNFTFYEDGSEINVQMMQPYGSDGIWVPYTETAAVSGKNTDTASIAPQIITSENVDDMIAEDAWQLETLFPDHHEFAFNADFPRTVDLNGDGVAEKIEMIDLRYNGGDGGYALRVTDTATGQQIPLPDGYTEESGFPITAAYVDQRAEGGDGQLVIQLGDETMTNVVTIATLTQSALFRIYERNHLYTEVKNQFFTDEMIAADALSGCNIITYQKEGQNEETPVLLLKTYISGYAGHIDTLGYVITELRLQKDNTWASWHYFLLDSCDDTFIELQNSESIQKGGALFLPFTVESDFDIVQLNSDK